MKRQTKKHAMTRPTQPLNHVEELNQVRSLDFMHDTLHDSRPFRTLNVIKEGNREGLRIEIGRSHDRHAYRGCAVKCEAD